MLTGIFASAVFTGPYQTYNMYNDKTIGANIKLLRLFRNYSQDYVARQLNISQNAFSKLELGYTRFKLDNVITIAQVLNVDLNRLIEEHPFAADIEAVNRIPLVPKILETVCITTGMGFAAIARVTEDRWITCSVCDKINFGLIPGSELRIETTICNEIRQNGQAVIIDEVSKDEVFANHHTPAIYGFQSYISVPIMRQDGTMFGTLCAIDPKPAKINNPATIATFNSFADLISFHLDSVGFYQNENLQQ